MSNVDLNQVLIAEIYAAEEINLRNWSLVVGKSYTYQTSISDLNFSEISTIREIKENNNNYVLKSSINEVEATAGSYYIDYAGKYLYVHTTGNDSPSAKSGDDFKYCILAYFWIGLSSGLKDGFNTAFPIQGNNANVFYQPIIKELPQLTIAVGEYYSGTMRADIGELQLLPSLWILTALQKWVFQAKEIIFKIIEEGKSYSEFKTIARGYIKNISKNDEGVQFQIEDRREIELGDIPPLSFSLASYPNMDQRYDGQPIPIPFGQVENIIPILINSSSWRYKVSPYAIDSFIWIKKDDALLVSGTDYTAYPSDGEFVLSSDPGNSLITCGVKGIKISYFGAAAAFSENIADVLYFILTQLCGISSSAIDKNSFDALKAARTQKLSWWFAPTQKQPAIEAIRRLMATFLFHLVSKPDGKYYVRYYEPGETGATEFRNEDVLCLEEFREDYDSVYSSVIVLYDFNPQTGEWKRIEVSESKTEYRYKKKNSLTIESVLRDSNEAVALAQKYLKMYRNPLKRLKVQLPPQAFDLLPADKIKISKKIFPEGTPLYLLENQVYVILESRIDFSNPYAEISAIDLSQAAGAVHSDTAHEDSHGDSHSDIAHSDIAHQDGAYVDHDDSPHQDSHSDQAYQDIPHEDSHSDSSHVDYTHNDHGDYYDDPLHDDHSDYYHEDVEHSDSYTDSHTDSPHEDSHSDQAHEDQTHNDYYDSPHSDISHEDSHSDSHSDVAHIDSWY